LLFQNYVFLSFYFYIIFLHIQIKFYDQIFLFAYFELSLSEEKNFFFSLRENPTAEFLFDIFIEFFIFF
jgi:hypothetical protein